VGRGKGLNAGARRRNPHLETVVVGLHVPPQRLNPIFDPTTSFALDRNTVDTRDNFVNPVLE
jgi:hypothetical protein